MLRRKAGAGSMATTSCPSSFKVSGSPTGSKSPPNRRPLSPKLPPPEPSGRHQDSAIAPGPGGDIIDIAAFYDSFADLKAHAHQSGNDVAIGLGHNDQLILANVKTVALGP